MEPKSQWVIVGGPSKYDLITALSFRRYPEQQVTFKIKKEDEAGEIIVSVHCIMRHNQGDKLPGVEGDLWRVYGCGGSCSFMENFPMSSWFLADYSTKTRTGWIKVLERKELLLIEASLGFAWAQRQLEM